MLIVEKGHHYILSQRDTDTDTPQQELVFVNKEPGREHAGTTTQEVLRALIDRTRYCNNCLPHDVNKHIVHHLRMALVLHESRALEMKVAKGELKPELAAMGDDGHFSLSPMRNAVKNETAYMFKAPLPTDPKPCTYQSHTTEK